MERTLLGSAVTPLRFAFFMWLIFALEYVYGFELVTFGLVPRDITGAIGIVTSPFFHADPIHLISNTVPFLFVSVTIFYYYPYIAKKVFFGCYILTNLLVWIFARSEIHIGASGLVYGLVTFVIFLGLFRRDLKSLGIAALTGLLYAPIYYGVLPLKAEVSWESHLFGSFSGVLMAFIFREEKNL